jgi:hypothetical protein
MPFSADPLDLPIDPNDYVANINDNFEKLRDAVIAVDDRVTNEVGGITIPVAFRVLRLDLEASDIQALGATPQASIPFPGPLPAGAVPVVFRARNKGEGGSVLTDLTVHLGFGGGQLTAAIDILDAEDRGSVTLFASPSVPKSSYPYEDGFIPDAVFSTGSGELQDLGSAADGFEVELFYLAI